MTVGWKAIYEKGVFESLRGSPLMVGDLAEGPSFERSLFGEIPSEPSLLFDQKLGHLYEDAVGLMIEASENLDLLARNLQIFDRSKRTIGELDFLIRDSNSGVVTHLELAVKFYLIVEKDGCWSYPGPDPRDDWRNKLERLRHHQLCLSGTDDAKTLIEDRFGVKRVDARQLVYGRIFGHIYAGERNDPPCISHHCRRSKWLYAEEVDGLVPNASKFKVIPKPLWAVELSREILNTIPSVNRDDLRSLGMQRCIMFVEEDSMDPKIMVPETWPTVG